MWCWRWTLRSGVDLFLDVGLFLDVLQTRSIKDGKPFHLPKPQWRECEVKDVKSMCVHTLDLSRRFASPGINWLLVWCWIITITDRSILVQYLTEHMTEWIDVDKGQSITHYHLRCSYAGVLIVCCLTGADTGRLADLHERVLPQTQLDLALGGTGRAGPSGARIPQPLIDALNLPKLTEGVTDSNPHSPPPVVCVMF